MIRKEHRQESLEAMVDVFQWNRSSLEVLSRMREHTRQGVIDRHSCLLEQLSANHTFLAEEYATARRELTFEQLGDVGVLEVGQDLAFLPESALLG